ncbi:CATRA conflict system CASPASE/TPR repeat-associated protein [Dactylosporangium sp. CA-092794]|uniref:CATRA conflict system CASPASE/TPR repeat-associated protein n=1 Tax=Dactylosporangium sp. CA-092794 TaxID=3239929 RepID=UPI003D94A495
MRPEELPADPDTVDALAVLGDVPQWRMPAGRWPAIAAIIERMGRAVDERDPAALAEATAELELASPLRYTLLGSTPLVPPPPPVYLLRNHLVQALGGQPAQPAAPVVLPSRADTATEGLVKQDFFVHVFAPVVGEHADAAQRLVRQLWDVCAAEFGATEPIDGLRLPARLPDDIPDGAAAAAAGSPDGFQAIVRREHDHVVLSVAAARDDTTWAQWAARWEAATGGADDPALTGVVMIFGGTVENTPDATALSARKVTGALPPTVDDFWQQDGTAVGDCALWRLPPRGDARSRRLVVLGADEAALSALVWSRGDAEPTPFTLFLLNAAKVRHARRVRAASAARIDERPVGWLEDLRDAVKIAWTNMSRALHGAGGPAEPVTGSLADDFAAAAALLDQLGYDHRHAMRAARSVPARPAIGPTFGLVTAMQEEFTAMRALIDDPVPLDVAGDRAVYVTGTVPSTDAARPHAVVLTMLAETGTDAAAHGAANLVRSFRTVDQIVMVGIAGGVPAPKDPDNHVRLGDIVAGTWNVVDFDHIVDRATGPERRQEFPRRSGLLAGRVKRLADGADRGERPWEGHLDRLVERLPGDGRPDARTDVLFSDDSDDATVVAHPDPARSGHRADRPKIHEGRIGSSNRSVRNAVFRDTVARRHNLRAIEMEGTGIGRAGHSDGRDWFVVRGISDYADRWIDAVWRRYAAAAAAAYVRSLLEACPPLDPHGGHTGGVDPI